MKDKLLFSIVIVILFCAFELNAQTTAWLRLSPSTGQSAYIADNYLTTSWPNHPDLIAISVGGVQGFPASARSLFEFNLSSIPPNSQILDARLSLFANPTPVNPGHGGPNESYLRRVETDWTNSTVLWEPQPDFTHHNEILLPILTAGQDITNLDVTLLVRDMVNNPLTSFGFILMQRFEYVFRSMNFASGVCADTSKRPLLVINFDEPLPVELTSFTSQVNGRNTNLNWTTSSEINNQGFEILRSNDNTEWIKIGFIEGSVNSNSPKNYSFTDRNLSTGRYDYRLKQIDINGNFDYYELGGEVSIGVPQNFSMSQNYPNPFNPSTKIFYDIPNDGNVNVRIYDESGREVKNLINEIKSAGYYTLNFNAGDFSSGAYFYKISFAATDGSGKIFTDSKKMILVK